MQSTEITVYFFAFYEFSTYICAEKHVFAAIVHLWPLRYIICSTRSSWISQREGNSVLKILAQVGYAA